MKTLFLSLACWLGGMAVINAQIMFPMNVFVGRDADSLKTTFRGLGSTNTPVAMVGVPYSLVLSANADKRTYSYLSTGLFVRWVKFRFDDDRFLLSRNGDQTILGRDLDPNRNYDLPYSKSKLVCSYLNLPVGFGFGKGLFFADVMLNFDVLIGGRAKRKYYENDEKEKTVARFKDNGNFGISPFQMGAGLRLGYWALFVYGSYNVTPFFKKDQNIQVNAASFGIGIDLGRLMLLSKLNR